MNTLNQIEIIGGGPAGLYTAILLRKKLPDVRVRITEQNPKGATFGFGVVFSNRALDFLKRDDPAIHDLITPNMERWEDMTLNLPNGQVTIDGIGFTAIGRLELIEILRIEAEKLGVETRFNTVLNNISDLSADLIIGADGLNSTVRSTFEDQFKPNIEFFNNHFAWFGADTSFDTLTQTFVNTNKGSLNAHHYRFSPSRSTFIVECEDKVFQYYGFSKMDEVESAEVCAEIFKDILGGVPLVTNKSMWRQFPRLWCERWVAGRAVLIGDSAHTAHFSIGSGTRLALEDAIYLVDALRTHSDIDVALANYAASRQPIAKKIVDAANASATWYESFGDRIHLPPLEFGYDYLNRSGRMDNDRLHQIAPEFMAKYEAWKGNAT